MVRRPLTALPSDAMMSLDELLDTQTRIAYTVRIATASRAELEHLCALAGLEHRRQPTPTLRSALRQRLETTVDRRRSADAS